MRATPRFSCSIAVIVVLATTLLPVSARDRGPGAHAPAGCANSACRCGSHEPGTVCCCAPGNSPLSGIGLARGSCFRQETDPGAPETSRLAVLPPLAAFPGPPSFAFLARTFPDRAATRGGALPDPVPRPFA